MLRPMSARTPVLELLLLPVTAGREQSARDIGALPLSYWPPVDGPGGIRTHDLPRHRRSNPDLHHLQLRLRRRGIFRDVAKIPCTSRASHGWMCSFPSQLLTLTMSPSSIRNIPASQSGIAILRQAP